MQIRRKCASCESDGGGYDPQSKLTVGAANDPLEIQADAAADSVVTGREVPALSAAGGTSPKAQRACAACEEEEQAKLQRKSEVSGPASAANTSGPDAAVAAIGSGGRPLSAAERNYFEPRFGRDFSAVRVHEHGTAHSAARSINARAYTIGQNIAFAQGQYAPGSAAGRHLMAHELAHTVQQAGSVSRRVSSGQLIQRACGEKQIEDLEVDDPGKIRGQPGDSGVNGILIRFRVGCDEFLTREDAARVRGFWAGEQTPVTLHGFASEEGKPGFNDALSVARALKVRGLLSRTLNPAQMDIVWHGGVPGNRPDRRSVIIEPKAPVPAKTTSISIVSWINGTGLPSFSRLSLVGAPHGYVERLGACMALKCTANTAPPNSLPDSDLPAFIESKQYRALQTFQITHPAYAAPGHDSVVARQLVGYTAPSSCGPIPPDTFVQGEASPLNHVSVNGAVDGTNVDTLMKIRVSTAEESAAVNKATSFPNSLLVSRSRISHVPWVWSSTHLHVDALTGLIRWQLKVSAFPTNTVYANGRKIAEIPQQGCNVLLDPSLHFRNIDQPRQSLEEEARQADVPVEKQDESVKLGGIRGGSITP